MNNEGTIKLYYQQINVQSSWHSHYSSHYSKIFFLQMLLVIILKVASDSYFSSIIISRHGIGLQNLCQGYTQEVFFSGEYNNENGNNIYQAK